MKTRKFTFPNGAETVVLETIADSIRLKIGAITVTVSENTITVDDDTETYDDQNWSNIITKCYSILAENGFYDTRLP